MKSIPAELPGLNKSRIKKVLKLIFYGFLLQENFINVEYYKLT